jgi:hypothetical protein
MVPSAINNHELLGPLIDWQVCQQLSSRPRVEQASPRLERKSGG